MTNDDGRKPEGAPERSAKAGAGAPSGVDGNGPKRFSVQRKMAIVARLLRGEPLELVARETNVSIARLSEWRERALAGAATARCAVVLVTHKLAEIKKVDGRVTVLRGGRVVATSEQPRSRDRRAGPRHDPG